jgi:hypothetical protein
VTRPYWPGSPRTAPDSTASNPPLALHEKVSSFDFVLINRQFAPRALYVLQHLQTVFFSLHYVERAMYLTG